MPSRRIVVIDCGASRTALGVFSLSQGNLRCDRLATVPLSTQTPPENWLQESVAALRVIAAEAAVRGPAVLVLPPHAVLLKTFTVPRVTPVQRDKVLRCEAAQHIPYPLAEVAWDTLAMDERAGDGEMLLAAVKVEIAAALCGAARRAGFEVRTIFPSLLAVRAAEELTRATPDDRLLLLDVGARSVGIMQLAAARFAVRSFPRGSDPVAAASAGDAGGPWSPLAESLAHEVGRSLLHFRRQGRLDDPLRVILTGGVSAAPGLAEELAGQLKLPVRRLELGKVLERSGQVSADLLAEAPVGLAGAAALALMPAQPRLNLLPVALRRAGQFRRRRPWLALAAFLVAAAFVPPALYYRRVAGTTSERIRMREESLLSLRGHVQRHQAALARLASLQLEVQRLQAIQAGHDGWLRFLADLENRVVPLGDAWVDQLRMMPAAGDRPLRLLLSGRMLDREGTPGGDAADVSHRMQALLAALRESPFVSAVEAERFDRAQPGILKFECVLVSNPAQSL